MTEQADIIAAMANLPMAFRAGYESAIGITRQSGFLEGRDGITVPLIAAYLAGHPALVEMWKLWSMDKRTTSGWYFAERRLRLPWQRPWVVGYWAQNGVTQVKRFRDPCEACATFVLRECEQLAEYALPPNDR